MNVHDSQWERYRAVNVLLFYAVAWAIPLVGFTTYMNWVYGPAILRPIPEGYEPSEEEYQRSPVTRFFVKYDFNLTEQARHETMMHDHWQVNNEARQRQIFSEVSFEDFLLKKLTIF